jgi:hypothetical protein
LREQERLAALAREKEQEVIMQQKMAKKKSLRWLRIGKVKQQELVQP